jgi:hypothetical protein
MSVQVALWMRAADRAQRHRPCVGWLLAGCVVAGTFGAAAGLAAEDVEPGADRRVKIVTACGSSRTVNVVKGALGWLAKHQLPDGGWSFDHGQAPECQGRCRNPGQLSGARNAATGLALLALLGGGNTPTVGPYRSNVKAGIDFLVGRMKETEHGGSFHESGGMMYSQGIATLALCEAYAMTADKKLHGPAQQAIDFIAYAQDTVGGGWRYQPRQKGDLSVTGWQLTALKSGHFAYLRVPAATVMKVSKLLDSVQADQGARYGYMKPATDRKTTTAVGLLMRMHLGWKNDNAAFQRGVEWLSDQGPSESNLYYDYYATQLMHQMGGELRSRWNAAIREHLESTQSEEGHEKGSWYFEGDDLGSERGGRLYSTAMALMILEVYYRHLRIYDRPSDRQRSRETHPGLTPDEE